MFRRRGKTSDAGRPLKADARPSAGSLAFRRGWIASTVPVRHDVADDWDVVRFGPLEVRVHPMLDHAATERVLVLGNPVDLDAVTADCHRIAEYTGRARDPVRYVAYLGGRFTVLIWDGQVLTVIPDAVAGMPIYWHRGDALTLGSHSHLVGEVVGAELDERPAALMRAARDAGAKRTVYWPGVETPFAGVLPVLPNHLLSVGQEVRHERFYPFPDTDLPRDPAVAFTQFRDLFTTHVRLLCTLGRIGVSLTGGLDSRTTFTAARPHLGEDALTWTYYKFDAPNPAMQADLLAANRIATDARVPHRVVAIERTPGDFSDAYLRSFRYTQQFRALAEAYHQQLPADVVELQSMVAEVGTGFYKHRSEPFSLPRMAALYSGEDHGRTPEAAAALERFVEYASFDPNRFGAVDWHDLFYWESRIGRWGTLRMQEVDLAHRIVLPFNARGIVEALQGPALPERVKKQALARFVG